MNKGWGEIDFGRRLLKYLVRFVDAHLDSVVLDTGGRVECGVSFDF